VKEALFGWANQSGFSPLASPASQPPAPESSEEAQMTAGSGHRLCACFDTTTPLGRFSRILLESETWVSQEFSLKWRLKATKCGSTVFQLAPSARRIDASGIGSWPTPAHRDTRSEECSPEYEALRNAEARGKPLTWACKTAWQTPTKQDNKSDGEKAEAAMRNGTASTSQMRLRTQAHGPISSGCLARTESFAVRLTILSAWLMAYPWSYLKNWERKGDRRRKIAK
jgi:hypothetical protein